MLQNETQKLRIFPGPKGLKLFKLGIKLQDRKLNNYIDIQNEYGPIVRCAWPNKELIFIFDPELTNYILKKNHTNYQKSTQYDHMKPLLGNGLLLSEGALWRNQRSIMAKEFHPQRLQEFSIIIENISKNFFQNQPPQVANLYDYLSELTFKIACELFFGVQLNESGIVQNSLVTESTRIQNRVQRPFNFPNQFPTKENRQGNLAISNLRLIVQKIMSTESHHDKKNILSKLMLYKDANQAPMDANLIRDEIMTLMLAGHETTSTALMWTLYLLAKNPKFQKLYQSIEKTQSQTRQNYLRAFLLEGMRLYPPVPLYSRRAISADNFQGYKIPINATLACVPYVLHRNPTYWHQPDEFIPERFLNIDYEKIYEHIYVPFAKGPRACIGKDLAILEGEIILKTILDQYIVSTSELGQIEPLQNLTLKPNIDIPLSFQRINHA